MDADTVKFKYVKLSSKTTRGSWKSPKGQSDTVKDSQGCLPAWDEYRVQKAWRLAPQT